jgi:O-methyltransferase involved in polyketide biosynthesis
MNKDYSSISPSAQSLLLMKGITGIPYAREAAALIPEAVQGSFDTRSRDIRFWVRVCHFESRYQSIDQLLGPTGISNVLELSSGYSFRGLDMATKQTVHYIDTDLPDVVAVKQSMLQQLSAGKELKGTLELEPLNAVDSEAFKAIVDRFPGGPLAIVNEGLLMYLNREEKQQLCRNIHAALSQKGGCWITADIYIKSPEMVDTMYQGEREKQFFEQHNIEENKFGSMEEAEAFFNEMGFRVVKEAEPDYSNVSGMEELMKLLSPEMVAKMQQAGKKHTTWMLEAV